MFNRLVRLIQSFFNSFLTAAEDPVLILENNIREMRNKIPKMNEGIARAHGAVILLERKLDQYQKEERDLRAKLKAAAMAGEDSIGRELALQLQRTINFIEDTKKSLTEAKNGLKTMEELRDTQLRKIKSETEKIRDAIENSKVAKLKGELATLFETYEVGDVSYSNQEMLEKLEQEAALNEGKLASASKSTDMKTLEIEKKAEEIQAEELYKQFTAEMNIDIAPSKAKESKKEKQTELN